MDHYPGTVLAFLNAWGQQGALGCSCYYQEEEKLHKMFSTLKVFQSLVSKWQHRPHQLYLYGSSSEVMGQMKYPPLPGETCCNSVSYLDECAADFTWKKMPFSTLTCFSGLTEQASFQICCYLPGFLLVLASFPYLSLLLSPILGHLMRASIKIPKCICIYFSQLTAYTGCDHSGNYPMLQ